MSAKQRRKQMKEARRKRREQEGPDLQTEESHGEYFLISSACSLLGILQKVQGKCSICSIWGRREFPIDASNFQGFFFVTHSICLGYCL